MDHLLNGELSLLHVMNDEQLSLPVLGESAPLFSPLTPRLRNDTEPLAAVLEPAFIENKANTNEANLEWNLDDFLNFNGNTDAANQNTSNEQIETVSNNEESDLKALDRNRKCISSEVDKQIEIINPLLARVENEELVRTTVSHLDKLFMDMQQAHAVYLTKLNNEKDIEQANNWYDTQDKKVFNFKRKIIEYLTVVKTKQQGDAQSDRSERSSISRKSRASVASSTSTRAKLAAVRAKSAALNVKAAFLKRKQELRIAAEELELEQEIAEVRVEEQVYEKELNSCTDKVETTAVLRPNAVPFEATGLNTEQMPLHSVVNSNEVV